MPGQNTQQFYDLKPLVPFIDSGFILLTPNFRLARRIKAAWDRLQVDSGRTVWESLAVFPLETWLLQRWEDSVRLGLNPHRVLLSEGQSRELWQRAIEEEQRATGHYSLLQAGSAALLASQARERLLRWQVDAGQQPYRSQFELDEDCASFLAWMRRFERLMGKGDLATGSDCIAQLSRSAGKLPRVPLLLLDFDDIPPLFASCLEALGSPVEEYSAEGRNAACRILRFADKRAELDSIARWARELGARDPGARTGIVLSDMAAERHAFEYLLRRAFDCLGENYTSLPVNFSTGITLDRAPVVRDAMAVLRLALATVSPIEVTRLLRSRFLSLPDAVSPGAIKLLRQLYDSGRERLQVADLRYLACEVRAGEQKGLSLGACLMTMAGMRELDDSRPPSEWLQPLSEVLDAWGWPGAGPLDSLEHQQVQLWYQTLEQLAGYDEVSGQLSVEGLLALLQRLLSRQISQPQTPESAIQVLGPLEAAGLEFDYLWLCGMQASQWPAAPRPNPFIPVSLQRERRMPHATAEREWVFASGLMRQYLRGSRVVYASYVGQVEGVPEPPSALLRGFEMEADDSLVGIDPRWTRQWTSRELEVLAEIRGPAPAGAELANLRGGSALLEDQSQCPFRAFARRRLGAEPLGDSSPGESAADRGSLMHRALHLLFQEITDSGALAALDDAGEVELVGRCVGGAMEELPRAGLKAPSRGWRELEAERLQRLLRQWLAIERQRENFRVAATEEDLELQLESLRLHMRVDRIDRMADGSALIIDYKSGKCRLQDWLGERPAKPQLLLYSVAAEEDAAGLGFAQLREDDCRYVGAGATSMAPGIRSDIGSLVRGGWEVDSWEALNQRWRGQLRALAAEFLAGEAAVQPQPGACDWCHLQALCRVDEEVIA